MDAGRIAAGVLLPMVCWCGVQVMGEDKPMNAADVVALPRPAADYRLPYGEDPLQFGELRLPVGEGPFAVVMVIHGGGFQGSDLLLSDIAGIQDGRIVQALSE